MPGLIHNQTNVTLDMITDIANVTSPEEFLVKVNHTVFNGVYFFTLLWVLWILLFIAAQKLRDQPLNNAMYSGAVITVLSFIARGINVVVKGVKLGLLTDHQLWVFPLITIILAMVIWSMREKPT